MTTVQWLVIGDGDPVARDFVPATDAVGPMFGDSILGTSAYCLMASDSARDQCQ